MKKTLIVGATGNVGRFLVKMFEDSQAPFYAATTSPNASREPLKGKGEWVHLDVTDRSTFVLSDVDRVFLLRPPQLSKLEDVQPFLNWLVSLNPVHVVFMSVLGAQHMSWVPHRKIELEIERLELPHTFLRPSFFMQNFSGIHAHEIKTQNTLYVPAGKTEMSFVDAKDIALCAFRILNSPTNHWDQSYDITGGQILSYATVALIFSTALGRDIRYHSPNFFAFIVHMKKRGIDLKLIFVMTMLYIASRIKTPDLLSSGFSDITQRNPTTFEDFVYRERESWIERDGHDRN